ncbi:hypothetical protein [Streptomyces mirabilis]|uniref:hypothetical protein n=1 Tax=Streptomyces mirabilis TaxID=68239 RepID=UPI0036968310
MTVAIVLLTAALVVAAALLVATAAGILARIDGATIPAVLTLACAVTATMAAAIR